ITGIWRSYTLHSGPTLPLCSFYIANNNMAHNLLWTDIGSRSVDSDNQQLEDHTHATNSRKDFRRNPGHTVSHLDFGHSPVPELVLALQHTSPTPSASTTSGSGNALHAR